MQTSFTEKQLENKENKTSETILRNVFIVECATPLVLRTELMVMS